MLLSIYLGCEPGDIEFQYNVDCGYESFAVNLTPQYYNDMNNYVGERATWFKLNMGLIIGVLIVSYTTEFLLFMLKSIPVLIGMSW